MKTFKDKSGREWIIEITVGSMRRVKSLLDIKLTDAISGDLMQRLCSDEILMADLLYVLCKPQADIREVSDEQFGEGLAGSAFNGAVEAFWEELADFFRGRGGEQLRAMKAKLDQAREKVFSLAEKKSTMAIEGLMTSIESQIDEELAKISGPLSGS